MTRTSDPTTPVGPLAATAVRMARKGWHVFPVRRGGKTPAAPAAHPTGTPEAIACRGICGRWGHGLHDATADVERVRAMWRHWPAANIGLSCGPSGLVVIDLDVVIGPPPARVLRDQADDELTPRQVTNAASVLAWLCRRRGGHPDDLDTLTVTTPTGGRHLYYLAPPPPTALRVTSGAGITSALGWGIDVRAWGGYVVTPPSTRPDGPYQFAGGRLLGLPTWLLSALIDAGRVPGRRPTRHRASPASRPAGDDRRRRYLAAAVQCELHRVRQAPARSLNDTLTRAAFALGQLVAGAGLDPGQCAADLLDAARVAATTQLRHGGKPFNEPKTIATITRALDAGAAHPRPVAS